MENSRSIQEKIDVLNTILNDIRLNAAEQHESFLRLYNLAYRGAIDSYDSTAPIVLSEAITEIVRLAAFNTELVDDAFKKIRCIENAITDLMEAGGQP